MNKISFFLLVTLLFFNSIGKSQTNSIDIQVAVDYDARLFLTNTQKITFNRLYPKFDKKLVIADWEWSDVDPIALFDEDENRVRRRENFLFELNPYLLRGHEPNLEQDAFKILIENQIIGSEVLIDRYNAKILIYYTSVYDKLDNNGLRSLLEKISELGLNWAQTGGDNLYMYNGNILMGRYKSGFVSIPNMNIDKPNPKIMN